MSTNKQEFEYTRVRPALFACSTILYFLRRMFCHLVDIFLVVKVDHEINFKPFLISIVNCFPRPIKKLNEVLIWINFHKISTIFMIRLVSKGISFETLKTLQTENKPRNHYSEKKFWQIMTMQIIYSMITCSIFVLIKNPIFEYVLNLFVAIHMVHILRAILYDPFQMTFRSIIWFLNWTGPKSGNI